jgi:multidrug efflux pump subunit AcrB
MKIHALALLLCLAACNRDAHPPEDHGDHGHGHDAAEDPRPGLVFTLWDAHTELFVEFPALVVGQESRFVYRPVLRAAVRGWRVVMALALAGLLAAVVVATSLGRAFLPEFNEGTLTVSAVTLPGTSLTQSNEIGAWIERILLKRPEVTSVARRTGRAELDEHAQGVNAAELDVNLAADLPDREAFLAELRNDLAPTTATRDVIVAESRFGIAVCWRCMRRQGWPRRIAAARPTGCRRAERSRPGPRSSAVAR